MPFILAALLFSHQYSYADAEVPTALDKICVEELKSLPGSDSTEDLTRA